MRANSKGYIKVFLTFLGLGLLIFVIVFSHFRPQDQGVAAMGQNAIRNLVQTFTTDKNRPSDSFSYVSLLPAVPITNAPGELSSADSKQSANQQSSTKAPDLASRTDQQAAGPMSTINGPAGTATAPARDTSELAKLGIKPVQVHISDNSPDLKALVPQPESVSP